MQEKYSKGIMEGRRLSKLKLTIYAVAQDRLQTKVGGNTQKIEDVKNRKKLRVNS